MKGDIININNYIKIWNNTTKIQRFATKILREEISIECMVKYIALKEHLKPKSFQKMGFKFVKSNKTLIFIIPFEIKVYLCVYCYI